MAIVTDEQVIKVLRQYNPWWRNPAVIKEESKPPKRIAYYSGGLLCYRVQGASVKLRLCTR